MSDPTRLSHDHYSLNHAISPIKVPISNIKSLTERKKPWRPYPDTGNRYPSRALIIHVSVSPPVQQHFLPSHAFLQVKPWWDIGVLILAHSAPLKQTSCAILDGQFWLLAISSQWMDNNLALIDLAIVGRVLGQCLCEKQKGSGLSIKWKARNLCLRTCRVLTLNRLRACRSSEDDANIKAGPY